MKDSADPPASTINDDGAPPNTDLTLWERNLGNPIQACLKGSLGWIRHPEILLSQLARRVNTPFQHPAAYLLLVGCFVLITVGVSHFMHSYLIRLHFAHDDFITEFLVLLSRMASHPEKPSLKTLYHDGYPSYSFLLHVLCTSAVFTLASRRALPLASFGSSMALLTMLLFPMWLANQFIFTFRSVFGRHFLFPIPSGPWFVLAWYGYTLIVMVTLLVKLHPHAIPKIILCVLCLSFGLAVTQGVVVVLWTVKSLEGLH